MSSEVSGESSLCIVDGGDVCLEYGTSTLALTRSAKSTPLVDPKYCRSPAALVDSMETCAATSLRLLVLSFDIGC